MRRPTDIEATLHEHYRVDRLGTCGSYVRGEQTDRSDVYLYSISKVLGRASLKTTVTYLKDFDNDGG
jgi:predicted nucleotidyltransferase